MICGKLSAPLTREALKQEHFEAAAAGDLDRVIRATVLLENKINDVETFRYTIAWYGIAAAAVAGHVPILRYLLAKSGELRQGVHNLGYHMATERAAMAKPPQHRVVKWLLALGVDLSVMCCGKHYIDDCGQPYFRGNIVSYAHDVEDLLRVDIEDGRQLRPEAAAACL